MDIEQAKMLETDKGFRSNWYGSVCIQVVPPDPKVHKLATRSTFMDGRCISNKLYTRKSMRLPTFCSYRESVSQSNEGQVYVDHNNTSVAFATMVYPVIENAIQNPIFIPPFLNLLTDPNQNQHPLCQNQTLTLAAWKFSGNSILQKGYQTKQLTCLKVAKRGGKSRVAGIPFL